MVASPPRPRPRRGGACRPRGSGSAPLPPRGRGGAVRPLFGGPPTSTTAPPRGADRQRSCALRGLRMTDGRRTPEAARVPEEDHGLGHPSHPTGLGRLGRLGPGARPTLRALPAGRADPHRRQEARSDRPQRGRAPDDRQAALQPRPRRRTAGKVRQPCRLGVRPRLRRRRHAPGLRRGARRREGAGPRSASCAGRSPSSGATGSRLERLLTDTAAHTALPSMGAGLQGARDPPSAHPPLSAPDQRQGGALHPHDARPAGPMGRSTGSSVERTASARGVGYERYNFRRPHGALGRRTPAARLAELRNNALRVLHLADA